MARRTDPFALVLNQAADRLYLKSVWLGDDLRRDPIGTLHALSARPEAYGQLKLCHDAEARRQRVSLLLDAARAYIKADGKARAHAVDQLELKLPVRSGCLVLEGTPFPAARRPLA